MKKKPKPFYSIVTKPYRILDKRSDKYLEVIRFTLEDGSYKEIELPASSAAQNGVLASSLRDAGASLPLETKDYLQEVCASTSKHVRVRESEFGWTENFDNFLTNNGNVRGDKNILDARLSRPKIGKITTNGTVKEWRRKVLPFVRRSSTMMCTVCAAFAAPLLRIVDAEPFSICIFGKTRSGKTMATLAAGSIVGIANKKALPSWHLTVNHLETVLPAFNDSIFLIDDLQTFPIAERYKMLSGAAYSLAAGREKGRHISFAGKLGDHADAWSSIIVTSSEHSVAKLAREVGKVRDGGEVLRLIDLPAFSEGQEHIFDRSSSDITEDDLEIMFKDFLKAIASAHGTALQKYILHLLSQKKRLPRFIELRINYFMSRAISSRDDAIVRDIARKFALLYAGGCLAGEARLIPWERSEIFDGISTCFKRARSVLQTDDSLLQEGLDTLERTLQELPRFHARNEKEFTKAHCEKLSGYSEDKLGRAIAYLKRDQFVRLFVSRHQSQLIEQELLKCGRISHAASKNGHSAISKGQHRWPDKKRRRSVTIRFDRITSEAE